MKSYPPPHAANMTTDKRGKASFNFFLLNICEAVVLNIIFINPVMFYFRRYFKEGVTF